MNESLNAWFIREILVHEESLVRYLRRSWSSHADVHDLRQETYLRVYEAAAKARPRAAKSFLFTTARHLMTDRMRHGRVVSIESRGDLDALNGLADEISPEQRLDAHQELRRLAVAFERLSPKGREIVWLRRIEDLPQKEVARRLGMSEKRVEKHITRAMRRLADFLYGGRADISAEKQVVDFSEDSEHEQQHSD